MKNKSVFFGKSPLQPGEKGAQGLGGLLKIGLYVKNRSDFFGKSPLQKKGEKGGQGLLKVGLYVKNRSDFFRQVAPAT